MYDSLTKQTHVQYIPRNIHTIFALLCFVVVIHWLISPYPSGLLHWHCGNLTIAPVPAMQPWWIWMNTSCEFIMNDCITTTKQSTTKPCAYFLGYTVHIYNFPSPNEITTLWNSIKDNCCEKTNPCLNNETLKVVRPFKAGNSFTIAFLWFFLYVHWCKSKQKWEMRVIDHLVIFLFSIK